MEHIKILIVDDEILIAEDLKDILNSFGITKIEMAHDKNTAMALLSEFKPHVALLDIRMEKELDGLEIGEYINTQFNLPFIYITAHSDVAMIKEIVKTKPAGYITKPFKKSDLFANINLAVEQLKPNDKLSIKDGYDTVVLDYDDIYYIESEGNYLNVYTTSKKVVSRQSLDSLILELDPTVFIRIHRSYIINLNKINKYSSRELEVNQVTLPISKGHLAEFEKRLNKKR